MGKTRRAGKIESVTLDVLGVFDGSTVFAPADPEGFEKGLWGTYGYLKIRETWGGMLVPAGAEAARPISDEFVIVAHDGWEAGNWHRMEGLENVRVEAPQTGERWTCDLYFYPKLHGRALAVPKRKEIVK